MSKDGRDMAYFKKSAGCPSMLAQQVRVQRGALQ
eukprot:COSAG04_NODE_27813_length_279_cov_1.422222_1_plen_33_part_01